MAKNIILSNLCSAIRNGQKARKLEINISNNNKNLGIIKVLKREGYTKQAREVLLHMYANPVFNHKQADRDSLF